MQQKMTYQGVFEPAGDGAFSVYFPDLPGCISYGETLNEAQKNAQDALRLHLCGMEQDGDPIPAPSATPQVDPETAAGYLMCPVSILKNARLKIITVSELEANAEEYVEIAQLQDILIAQNGKVVAKLTTAGVQMV